jgi:hypothetical protein
MDAVIRNMLNWVFVWSLVMVGVVFLLNFFQQGFFIKYFKVKSSRGKKLLVQVETMTDRYLTVGYITEGFLIYKKRHSKENGRIVVPHGSVYKALGIHWINVDEIKNAVQLADYSSVSGFDAEKIENLYIRAIQRPSATNKKIQVIMILLIIILVAVIGFGFLNFKIFQIVKALAKI